LDEGSVMKLSKNGEKILKQICKEIKIGNLSNDIILNKILNSGLTSNDLIKLKLLYLLGYEFICKKGEIEFRKSNIQNNYMIEYIIKDLLIGDELFEILKKDNKLKNQLLSNEKIIELLLKEIKELDYDKSLEIDEILSKSDISIKKQIANLLKKLNEDDLDYLLKKIPETILEVPNLDKSIIKTKLKILLTNWKYTTDDLIKFLKEIENELDDNLIELILQSEISNIVDETASFLIKIFNSNLKDTTKDKFLDLELIYEKLDDDIKYLAIEFGKNVNSKYYKEFTELLGFLGEPEDIIADDIKKLLNKKFKKYLDYIINKLIAYESFSFLFFLLTSGILFEASDEIIVKTLSLLYDEFCDEIINAVKNMEIDSNKILNYKTNKSCEKEILENTFINLFEI
jgi:hypothetical protein